MAKYTIELGKDAEKQLADVAKSKGSTKADVIRRAVAAYVVLNEESSKGNKLAITDPNNNVLKELVSF